MKINALSIKAIFYIFFRNRDTRPDSAHPDWQTTDSPSIKHALSTLFFLHSLSSDALLPVPHFKTKRHHSLKTESAFRHSPFCGFYAAFELKKVIFLEEICPVYVNADHRSFYLWTCYAHHTPHADDQQNLTTFHVRFC